MKKTLAILGALMALLACNKQMAEPTVQDEGTQEVQVEFTVNRTDAFAGTKGTAKGSWNNGDVVFLFFKGIEAPKHVMLTFNGSKWNATAEGAGGWDMATEFSSVSDYKMTAVFLPYGSDAAVVEDGLGGFTILKGGVPYTGYFLVAQNVSYIFEGGKLKGEINLKVHEPSGGKLVHFDVIGHATGHAYEMSQGYLQPFSLIGVYMNMELNVETTGSAVPGYEDLNLEMVSFSGLLTSSGTVEYAFSIKDKTSGVNYSLNAGSHAAPAALTAISLGNLSTWMAERPYVDLGMTNEAGKHIMWATMNVGATMPEENGNYFAWGKTATKSEYKSDWSNYFDTTDGGTTFTMYNLSGGKTVLDPEDDAARVQWGGAWRMPTDEEWTWLRTNCHWEWTADYNGTGKAGMVVSGVAGYTDNSIFLPAAGYRDGLELKQNGVDGDYNSSTLIEYLPSDSARGVKFYEGSRSRSAVYRYYGISVRPVFTAD